MAVRFLILPNFCRFLWQQSLDSMQILPSITEWGYTELYQPLWTTIPGASKVLTLLKLCNCKKGCKDRCSCKMYRALLL